ncbi:O-antigen ligase family protein [Methylobacterium sp. ID0610]|uniref:O-antigen ligase family protein n=1 Tax=Methylobacterium carpenticola TaxID=3344827 RepID=UPI0036955D30
MNISALKEAQEFSPAIPTSAVRAGRWDTGDDRLAKYCTAMLFFSYLFPTEAAVRIGTVMTMRRLAIIVCLVPLVIAIVRKIRHSRYVPVVSDFFIIGFAGWVPFSAFVSGGAGAVGSNLGVLAFEIFVPYLIARVLLGNADRLLKITPILLCTAVIMLGLGSLDTLSGENILGRISTQIFGNFRTVKFYGDVEVLAGSAAQYRFGLARARGPIEHSILFGLFFVVLAPLMYFNIRRQAHRLFAMLVCALGVAIALSSAPMLLFGLVLAIILYDHLFQGLHWRWAFLLSIVIICVVVLFLIVEDPVVAFIRGFTLDPTTGMTRLEIWHWIGKNLVISPIFGVGDRDWFRPWDLLSSIDALWLVIALQYGYVGLALLIGVVLGSFFVITPRQMFHRPMGANERPRIAVNLALITFILASFTVHVWGSCWGLFGVIIGLRAGFTEALYLPSDRKPNQNICAQRV